MLQYYATVAIERAGYVLFRALVYCVKLDRALYSINYGMVHILLNIFNGMLGYFLRQLFYDDTLALCQSSSTAVDREDVPDLPQHLVVAVDPVEILVPDVDLRAARSHQSPAEFLFCSEFLQPGEIYEKRGDSSFKKELEVRFHLCTHSRADCLKYFELWDDLFLEHTENELLKVVTLFRDGGLHVHVQLYMYLYIHIHNWPGQT